MPCGRSGLVAAYRLLEVVAGATGLPRRLDAPLSAGRPSWPCSRGCWTGRGPGRLQLVTVVGDPGVGKSRLLRAFAERVAGRALVLEAACPADGMPAATRVAAQIVAAAARSTWAWPTELTATDRRGFPRRPAAAAERLAADRPVVLVVDDLHRADPLLLDLLEYLALFARDAALLLVAAGRRPADGRADPLAATARARLDLDLLPAGEAASWPPSCVGPGRVEGERLALAEGNPLLIEQVLGDRDGAAQALVGAELDELPAEERAVLETASVGAGLRPAVGGRPGPEPLAPRVGGLLLAWPGGT